MRNETIGPETIRSPYMADNRLQDNKQVRTIRGGHVIRKSGDRPVR